MLADLNLFEKIIFFFIAVSGVFYLCSLLGNINMAIASIWKRNNAAAKFYESLDTTASKLASQLEAEENRSQIRPVK